jgi:hypothetical protein
MIAKDCSSRLNYQKILRWDKSLPRLKIGWLIKDILFQNLYKQDGTRSKITTHLLWIEEEKIQWQ